MLLCPAAPAFVPPAQLATESSSGLSTLPLARQKFVILNMMFSLMTPGMLVEFEMYETPADIINEISTWESDSLNSTTP